MEAELGLQDPNRSKIEWDVYWPLQSIICNLEELEKSCHKHEEVFDLLEEVAKTVSRVRRDLVKRSALLNETYSFGRSMPEAPESEQAKEE